MITPDGHNLVFVLCLPRSGSTLLSVLLGSHSRILAPPEPWFLLPLLHLDKPGKFTPDFGSAHAALATVEFIGSGELMRLSRQFACGAYNHALAEAKKDIFLDKTPRYYHIVGELERLFPKSRRIWLVRDPLDIAASYLSSWNIPVSEICGSPLTQYGFDFLVGLPRIAAAVKQPGPMDFTLRYEQLVADPATALSALSQFLNVSFEHLTAKLNPVGSAMAAHREHQSGDRKILRTNKIHTASVGAWRLQLRPADLTALCRIISGEMLQELGYGSSATELAARRIRVRRESGCVRERKRILNRSDAESTGAESQVQIALRAAETRLVELDLQLKKSNELFQGESADLRTQLSVAQSHNEQLSKLLAEGEARMQQLVRDLDDLNQIARFQAANDQAQIENQQQQIRSLERLHQETAKRISELDSKLAEANKMAQEEIAKLHRQLGERDARLAAFDRDLREVNAVAAAATKDAAERMSQIETLQTLCAGATDRVSHLDVELAKANDLAQQQIAELHAQLAEREDRLAVLDQQLREVNAVAAAATKDAAERMSQIETLQTLCAGATDRVSFLDAELAKANDLAQQQIAELHEQLAQRDRRLAELDSQLREVNTVASTATKHADERLTQIGLLTAALRTHETENDKLHGELATLKGRIRQIEGESISRNVPE